MNTENKKWSDMSRIERVATIFVAAIIVAIVVFFISLFKSPQAPETVIPGMECYETRTALEMSGFSSERTSTSAIEGTMWRCSRYDGAVSYIVDIFSPGSQYVESYRVTVMLDSTLETIEKGRWMLKELSGIKYDGSSYMLAADFVEQNYNNDGASTIISGVRFEISAPSDFIRILNVTKVPVEIAE